ncbi:MAG TPA: helix-turn-helix domain-containing protein [Oligoflexus sp.]|uniref:winged helix-turn-helix transcriptional regulator n=1 Tax=Oligoflexus sp. TaxID=1971216 RepID=UPI002D74070A|nr:helix-turn-helix domain-containing protein [Oligoflexus sp.]HYX35444.1 helix-turn-helix domain-containing protein [Oligoflexus sp.]
MESLEQPGCMDDEHGETIRRALAIIGGKWKVLILWFLATHRVLRFGELRRKLSGISQHSLTSQLRELEESGLVQRVAYPEVPLRVEYSLTPEGLDLGEVYRAVFNWSCRNKSLLDKAAAEDVARF